MSSPAANMFARAADREAGLLQPDDLRNRMSHAVDKQGQEVLNRLQIQLQRGVKSERTAAGEEVVRPISEEKVYHEIQRAKTILQTMKNELADYAPNYADFKSFEEALPGLWRSYDQWVMRDNEETGEEVSRSSIPDDTPGEASLELPAEDQLPLFPGERRSE